MEKQSEIHEIVKDLIRGDQERVGASDDQIMAVAENIHGESGDVPFLEDIVRELTEEGIMSASYQDAVQSIFIPRPLDQFESINFFLIPPPIYHDRLLSFLSIRDVFARLWNRFRNW